ncbi:MAG: His/Gly/Thr/Pro-type tRNA ligase C-terminal domain-containing protein, partial [Mariprofundus sp.]
RLAMLLDEVESSGPDVAVVALGAEVVNYSLTQAAGLRAAGLSVVHCGGGAAKRQFKMADREGARFVAVIGGDEMESGKISLKNMATGEQQQLSLAQAVELIAT